MSDYEFYFYDSYKFVFKKDALSPNLLHIWARHTKTPEDAIRIWLEGDRFWNEANERFETFTPTEGVYWIWLEAGKVIMVISCFNR